MEQKRGRPGRKGSNRVSPGTRIKDGHSGRRGGGSRGGARRRAMVKVEMSQGSLRDGLADNKVTPRIAGLGVEGAPFELTG